MCDRPCLACQGRDYYESYLRAYYSNPYETYRCRCCTELLLYGVHQICRFCLKPLCEYCCVSWFVERPYFQSHSFDCVDGCGKSEFMKCNHTVGIGRRDKDLSYTHPNSQCDPGKYPPPYPIPCSFKKCIKFNRFVCERKKDCWFRKRAGYIRKRCSEEMCKNYCILTTECYYYYILRDKHLAKHRPEICWHSPCRVNCKSDLIYPMQQGVAKEATHEMIRNLPGGILYEDGLEDSKTVMKIE